MENQMLLFSSDPYINSEPSDQGPSSPPPSPPFDPPLSLDTDNESLEQDLYIRLAFGITFSRSYFTYMTTLQVNLTTDTGHVLVEDIKERMASLLHTATLSGNQENLRRSLELTLVTITIHGNHYGEEDVRLRSCLSHLGPPHERGVYASCVRRNALHHPTNKPCPLILPTTPTNAANGKQDPTFPKKTSNSMIINRDTKLFSDTPKYIGKQFATCTLQFGTATT